MLYAEHDYNGFTFFICDDEHLMTWTKDTTTEKGMPVGAFRYLTNGADNKVLFVGGYGRSNIKLPSKASLERQIIYAAIVDWVTKQLDLAPAYRDSLKMFVTSAFLATFYNFPLTEDNRLEVQAKALTIDSTTCREWKVAIHNSIHMYISNHKNVNGSKLYDSGNVTISVGGDIHVLYFQLGARWRYNTSTQIKPSFFFTRDQLEEMIRKSAIQNLGGLIGNVYIHGLTWSN